MKTKRYLVMAMTLFAGLALYSCGSDSDGDEGQGPAGSTGTLEVTPESTEISHAGGEINVTVKSDGYWSIKADQNWVSFDPMRGSQNGTFKVKVDKNSTESKRQVAITVSDDDQGLQQSFTVEQGPLEANFTVRKTGTVASDCIGILQFSFLGPQVGLLFEYELIKSGTLTMEMPNSHIHTMIATKEPSQYAYVNGQIDESIPTVNTGDNIFDNLAKDTETGASADFDAMYPRNRPKKLKIHLPAGKYWACHTMEIDVTEGLVTDEWGKKPDSGDMVPTEGATGDFFPLTENYDITVTFVAD